MSGAPAELDAWVLVARDRLRAAGVEIDAEVVDVTVILDLARDAAHSVARPAAPLTTFLLGYAAARAGGDPAAVREMAALLTALAAEHGHAEGDNVGGAASALGGSHSAGSTKPDL